MHYYICHAEAVEALPLTLGDGKDLSWEDITANSPVVAGR